MDSYKQLFIILGGIGLLIYGLELLGRSLQNLFKSLLLNLIGNIGKGNIKNLLAGGLVASILQSSRETLILIIGMLNKNIIGLAKSFSLILGANIGATIVPQLLSLNIWEIAPFFSALGCLLILAAKKSNIKIFGEALLGLGLMYLGIKFLASGFNNPLILSYINENVFFLNNSILVFIASLLLSFVLRSSTIVVAAAMALSISINMNISFYIPIILGSNVGSALSTFLESYRTNKIAKEASYFHIFINFFGAIIIPLFLNYYIHIVSLMGRGIIGQIANAHTLFNAISALILMPFIPLIESYLKRINPIEEISDESLTTRYIDERMLNTPSVALDESFMEIKRMGGLCYKNLDGSLKCFLNYKEAKANEISKREALINYLEEALTSYLVKISQTNLSINESKTTTLLFHIINDLERIGDHSENLLELAAYKNEHSLSFSEEALTELKFIYEVVLKNLLNSISSITDEDNTNSRKVLEGEVRVDSLEKQLKEDHFDRLNKGICSIESGTVFLDAISNLERVSDHCTNIAQIMIEIR